MELLILHRSVHTLQTGMLQTQLECGMRVDTQKAMNFDPPHLPLAVAAG